MADLIRRPECPRCEGSGSIEKYYPDMSPPEMDIVDCPRCHGTGIDEFRKGFLEMGIPDDE